MTVACSLSVDKDRTTLSTLIAALFYDLAAETNPKIPTHGEERERALRDLDRRGRKPVVLIVDEAHDLHLKTLVGLKRLMEVVADGGTLAIILAGHLKLRNDLRRPTMEEIGYLPATSPSTAPSRTGQPTSPGSSARARPRTPGSPP